MTQHSIVQSCQCYALTERMSPTAWAVGKLEHPPRQPQYAHPLSSGQGCLDLAAAVGKRAYVVDIQGCQQHPTPTALACEPGLARSVTVR